MYRTAMVDGATPRSARVLVARIRSVLMDAMRCCVHLERTLDHPGLQFHIASALMNS